MALDQEQFEQKLRQGTLTVREATEYAASKPGVSDSRKSVLTSLLNSGYDLMGIDQDMLYQNMGTGEVLGKFTEEVSGVDRTPSLQALNREIHPIIKMRGINLITKEDGTTPLYYDLEEAGRTEANIKKFQSRGERPMRGLIRQADFAEIYETNLPDDLDPKLRDAMDFHRITGVRMSQIFTGTESKPNKNQITKNMVTIEDDVVKIKGISKTKKNRPDLTVPRESKLGQIILRAMETKGKKLFDVKQSTMDLAYRKYISPTLLALYEDKLPLNEKTGKPLASGMVARSAFGKQLADEFRIGDAETEFMMGHKGSSILRGNYAGQPEVATADFLGLTSGERTIDINPQTGDIESALRFKSQAELDAEADANVAAKEEQAEAARYRTLESKKKRMQFLSTPEGQELLRKEHELKEEADFQQEQRRLSAQQRRQAEKQAAEAEAKEARAAKRRAFTEAFNKNADRGLKGLAVVAAGSLLAEGAEAADRGEYGLAARRTLQAGEELLSPLPITTRDIEEVKPVESQYGSQTLGEVLQKGLEKTGRSISEQTSELFDRN